MVSDSKVSIMLKFKDSEESIMLKDKDLLGRLPLVVRAVSSDTADWEEQDVVVAQPLELPFLRESGEFVLQNLRAYQDPKTHNVAQDVEKYPEANAKTLEELRDIIELACFLECEPLVSCIGLVIADKLKDMDADAVADYLGLEKDIEAENDDDIDWMHPPLAALKAQRNF